MLQQLDVYFLPALVQPQQLRGKVVVVVDVLRATTTIVHALAHGARAVFPCLEIDEARQVSDRLTQEKSAHVLGGERGGKRIAGFTFGNSPAEYTSENVQGKEIVFSTTNGTRAMHTCREAERVFIGGFINLAAVANALQKTREAAIVCAGTDGEVTREDVLFAGALTRRLQPTALGLLLNDQATLAADAWSLLETTTSPRSLVASLRASKGGRNLIALGMESDIALAAQLDQFPIVPELNTQAWRIALT